MRTGGPKSGRRLAAGTRGRHPPDLVYLDAVICIFAVEGASAFKSPRSGQVGHTPSNGHQPAISHRVNLTRSALARRDEPPTNLR